MRPRPDNRRRNRGPIRWTRETSLSARRRLYRSIEPCPTVCLAGCRRAVASCVAPLGSLGFRPRQRTQTAGKASGGRPGAGQGTAESRRVRRGADVPSPGRPAIPSASGSAAVSSSLLWRDDLDTAFRHLDLYDRFGCPSAHIQATLPLPDPAWQQHRSEGRRQLERARPRLLDQPGGAGDAAARRRRRRVRRRAASAAPPPAAALAERRSAVEQKTRRQFACLEFATSGRYLIERRSQGAFPRQPIAEPWGRVRPVVSLPRVVRFSMRTVAAVLALVACVHVGLWASLRTKETAPNFTGQLASISYAPFVSLAASRLSAIARPSSRSAPT